MTYTLSADSIDEAAWHAARAHTEDGQLVVTASEIATLAHGGTSAWTNLRAEKEGMKARFGGNEYTAWGHERESEVAGAMLRYFPELNPNTRLIISDSDPRWRATPDMIGDDLLCQIKTSKWRGEKWTLDTTPARIYDQMQWEMFVAGVTENVLAVEYYDDLGAAGFVPTFPFDPPDFFIVPRDDDRITELVRIAEQFCAMDAPDPMDLYLADYAAAHAREQSAKAEKDEIRKLIAKEIAERPSGKYVSSAGSVTQGEDAEKTVTVLDEDLFRSKAPKIYARYLIEKTTITKGRLTITPAKEQS